MRLTQRTSTIAPISVKLNGSDLNRLSIVSTPFIQTQNTRTEEKVVELTAINVDPTVPANTNVDPTAYSTTVPDDIEAFKKMEERFTTNLLGNPHQGTRQFFYMLDPFKAEQFVRAPKMFDDINIYFALLYFGSLILYCVYILLAFLNQSPVQVNSMVLATSLQPVYINVTISCSQPYGCGTWTSSGVPKKVVLLKSVWNQVDSSSPCYGSSSIIPLNISASMPTVSVTTTVCFSSSSSDGVVLSVPFNSTSAILNVVVAGSGSQYTNGMNEQLSIAASQWKTCFFSQTKSIDANAKTSSAPYVADLFYNGHAPTTSTSSSLTFRLQQFGYLTKQTYPLTPFTALATIGGFSTLALAVATMMRGTIVMAYKSVFTLKEASSRGGLGANAFTLGLTACARCFGLQGYA